jgi:hypothetical protein
MEKQPTEMNRIEEMESLANKICKAEAGQEPNETNLAFRKTLVHGMNMWNQHIGSNLWTSPCICPNDEKTGETLCCNHCGKPTARMGDELPGDEEIQDRVEGVDVNFDEEIGYVLGAQWMRSIASPLLASRDSRIRELEEHVKTLEETIKVLNRKIEADYKGYKFKH